MKRKIESEAAVITSETENGEVTSSDTSTVAKKAFSDGPKEKTISHELKNASKHLYRPPTSDEINQLKETESLYKNSLFRMQIGYLLDEIRVPEKKCKHVDGFLHSLRDVILACDTLPEKDMSDPSWFPDNVAFPIPNLIGHGKKGTFRFVKPSNVTVVGSYLLKTISKPNLNVDIAVEIPMELFHPRDFLNYRYHFKRGFYLSVLASKLKEWHEVKSVTFARIQNDPYKPYLILKPTGPAGKVFTINVLLTIPEDGFKLFKFSPTRNNVRESWFDGKEHAEKNEQGPPTPHYNRTLLYDMLFRTHLKFLNNAISNCPGMRDATMLLKVWLRQRSFHQGRSAINGFMVSMILGHLLTMKKISNQMSSYQIIRVAFQYIAVSDWRTHGVSMAVADEIASQPSLEEFHTGYDVVFVEPSGFMNLFGHVESTVYGQFRYEAELALRFLDEKHTDSFDVLFIKPVTFSKLVDHCFTLPSLLPFKWLKKDAASKAKVMDRGGDWKAVAPRVLLPAIVKGLGSRIHHLIVKPDADQEWKVSKTPPKSSLSSFTCGLLLNTEHSSDLVNMGPPADLPEALPFREFWGSRSELRRFQDGSINEAVVWEADCASDRRMICKQVVTHLLDRYCKCPPDALLYVGDQLDRLVAPTYRPDDANHNRSKGTGEELQLNVIKSFDALSKNIKSLKGIPLDIKSLQGTSSVFRMTEIFPPRPRAVSKGRAGDDVLCSPHEDELHWVPSCEVVLQFESSGRWPDDVAAIRHLRAALQLKLAELLQTQCSLTAVGTAHFTDVVKDGYVFRIVVCHYREMVLLRQSTSTQSHTKKVQEQDANAIESRLVTRPLHSSYIYGLHQEHVSFSLTTRLAKRWVSSQMLLGSHLSAEAIELMVAYVYLHPAPFNKPSCHVNGFMRFLDLTASFDWQHEPLIVDVNNSLTDDDHVQIREHFTAQRTLLPPMVIAAPHDKTASLFTKSLANQQVLRRLQMLAKLSLETLQSCLESNGDVKQLFRPPLDGYDAVIRMHNERLPRAYQAVDSSVAIKAPTKIAPKCHALPVVDFNPARLFLNELQTAFGDIAMFFHDECGGAVIGIVWKPSSKKRDSFKVLSAGGKIPLQLLSNKSEDAQDETTAVVPNLPAILSDMSIMGRGLVKEIETQHDR